MIPQVTTDQTKGFAQQWTYGGLAVPIDDVHLKFATDFANIVLKSFIQDCADKAAAAQKAKEQTTIIEG